MNSIWQITNRGIDDLQLKSTATPHRTPLGTLIQVTHVLVLPWDLKSERGELQGLTLQRLPHIIGYGFAGIVLESGLGGPQPGSRVVGITPNGSYAEIVNAPFLPMLFTIPKAVSLASAATLIGGADAAVMMLSATAVTANTRVLVLGGSGGIGTYLLQLLHQIGASTQVLSSPRSHRFTQSIVPTFPVTTDLTTIADSAIDVILDTTGQAPLLDQAVTKLRSGGTLFTTALPHYQAPRQDIHSRFANNPIGPAKYRSLLQQLANGTLTAYVSQYFNLPETIAAQHYAEDHPARGRVLVQMTAQEGEF